MVARNKTKVNVKRWHKNQTISFPFFAGSPHTPRRFFSCKEMVGFLWRPKGARGAQSYHASGAYAEVQSHHALRACEDQSLRDWFSKKVRAKRTISPRAPKVTRIAFLLFVRARSGGIRRELLAKPDEKIFSSDQKRRGRECLVELNAKHENYT